MEREREKDRDRERERERERERGGEGERERGRAGKIERGREGRRDRGREEERERGREGERERGKERQSPITTWLRQVTSENSIFESIYKSSGLSLQCGGGGVKSAPLLELGPYTWHTVGVYEPTRVRTKMA